MTQTTVHTLAHCKVLQETLLSFDHIVCNFCTYVLLVLSSMCSLSTCDIHSLSSFFFFLFVSPFFNEKFSIHDAHISTMVLVIVFCTKHKAQRCGEISVDVVYCCSLAYLNIVSLHVVALFILHNNNLAFHYVRPCTPMHHHVYEHSKSQTKSVTKHGTFVPFFSYRNLSLFYEYKNQKTDTSTKN